MEKVRREREAFEAAEAARKKMVEEHGDELVDGFFNDLEDHQEKLAEEKRQREAQERRERVQSEKTRKYTEQALGSSEEQVRRLTQANYGFRNLNPFFVFQLDIDATVEDIKFRYKKLSVLVHPDKNLGLADAQTAFDEVKKSYEELLDDERRQRAIDIIDATRAETQRERRRLIRKGLKEKDFEPLDTQMEKDVMKAFASEWIAAGTWGSAGEVSTADCPGVCACQQHELL